MCSADLDIIKNQDTVPVVALALGPTAGMGAARTVASHYSIMVKGLSQIFAAGPAVAAAIGDDLSKEQLGGSDIHTTNGVVDEEVASEAEAFVTARKFLSYLPSNVNQLAARTENWDPVDRKDESLLSAVPRADKQVYSMRKIMTSVFDEGSVFEMGKRWGRAAITALGRLERSEERRVGEGGSSRGESWTQEEEAAGIRARGIKVDG